MALSSAAVLAIYSAGYLKTEAAAEALELESAVRRERPADPAPADSVSAEVPQGDTSIVAAAPVVVAPLSTAPTGTDTVRSSLPAAAPVTATPASIPLVAATTAPNDSAPVPVPADTVVPLPVTPPAPVAATPTPPAEPAAPAAKVIRPLKDGTWYGYGSSRHGDLEVKIEVADRRIVHVEISKCLTRYSCSWIEALPGQVVTRQTADVDVISGATVSSDAFYMAVMDAMNTSRSS